MAIKRASKHTLFWLTYFIINLFNELYLSESFSLHPSFEMFLQCVVSCLIILSVKAGTTYLFIYYLIPRWIKTPANFTLYIQAILITLAGTLLIRLAIHFIIWPYIYDSEVTLSPIRLMARYFYSLLDLLQVVGIASAIKLYNLRMQAREMENELVKEKLKAEILHLKSQVNPHFLFNTLNSIYALALTQSASTPDALMRLSKILRYILYETKSKTVLLDSEIKILEDYINLQQLRFSGRINIIPETLINDKNAAIAPLLLLPLLENAYKHSNDLEATIKIFIGEKDGILNMEISNTVTPESVKHEQYGGIGLKNIKRQLELLYNDYSLLYKTENGIFTLNLRVDLNSYANIELPYN